MQVRDTLDSFGWIPNSSDTSSPACILLCSLAWAVWIAALMDQKGYKVHVSRSPKLMAMMCLWNVLHQFSHVVFDVVTVSVACVSIWTVLKCHLWFQHTCYHGAEHILSYLQPVTMARSQHFTRDTWMYWATLPGHSWRNSSGRYLRSSQMKCYI